MRKPKYNRPTTPAHPTQAPRYGAILDRQYVVISNDDACVWDDDDSQSNWWARFIKPPWSGRNCLPGANSKTFIL
jgi:hypothetical protein